MNNNIDVLFPATILLGAGCTLGDLFLAEDPRRFCIASFRFLFLSIAITLWLFRSEQSSFENSLLTSTVAIKAARFEETEITKKRFL